MTYTDVANQEQAVKTFQSFSVDDRLALLWQIYSTFGGAITQENSSDTAGYDALEALIPEVEQMLPEQQLQMMRDLVSGADAPINRSYGEMYSSNQMAFWYKLAQGMDKNTIVQAPSDYQLPVEAKEFLNAINGLSFEDKVVFLRNIVSKMGVKSN